MSIHSRFNENGNANRSIEEGILTQEGKLMQPHDALSNYFINKHTQNKMNWD